MNTSSRSLYFDNGKGILIILVVFGHFLEPFLNDPGFLTVYKTIYSFHMQLFALISGFFSSETLSQERFKKNVTGIRIPYLIAQSIFLLLKSVVEQELCCNLLTPISPLWYLLSLFTWRTVLPFAARFRAALPLSIALALVVGYITYVDRDFSLSRTIVFFPYFLAGFYLKKHDIQIPSHLNAKLLGCCILVAIALASAVIDEHFEWLFHSRPDTAFYLQNWQASLFRFGSICVGFLACFAVLSLIPNRRTWFAGVGEKSLSVYLLHIFIFKIVTHLGWFPVIEANFTLWIILPVITLSIVHLCTNPVAHQLTTIIFRPIRRGPAVQE